MIDTAQATMDLHSNSKYIYLQPFIHQVGGHSSMLCLDENRLCKPAIDRELAFYQSLPPPLRPFTPLFHGTVQVDVLLEGEFMCLVASSHDNITPSTSPSPRLRLRRSGSVELLPSVSSCIFATGDDSGPGTEGATSRMNPWVLKCLRDHLTSLVTAIRLSSQPKNFLVLENLTSPFRLPCILDLKMGTRQYDEADSLPKRQSKMFKVVSTTTGKLGLRIAGMQVYQASTGMFLCRNKLFGRSLTPAGFSLALRQFLHDGYRLRTELLSPFIRRLQELSDTLAGQGSLRLFTTSLLLIYEGDSSNEYLVQDRLLEKRDSMVKSQRESQEEDLLAEVESEGMERSASVESLSWAVEEVPEVRRSSRTPIYLRRRSSSCARHIRSMSDVSLAEKKGEPSVDVRIIDFAHSWHEGIGPSAMGEYSGPDESFLFGLDNIITILKGIDRDVR